MKDYADYSILVNKDESAGNCSAKKFDKSELGVAGYVAIHLPSGSTCCETGQLKNSCLFRFKINDFVEIRFNWRDMDKALQK